MLLTFNEKLSDSPLIERVWRSQSHSAGVFLSMAMSHFEIAVTRHRGQSFLTVRGPETKATPADCPCESAARHESVVLAEWLGVGLSGFRNAETFVARLARKGMITRDPVVHAALEGGSRSLPIRSTQRHFLRATGITHRTFRPN